MAALRVFSPTRCHLVRSHARWWCRQLRLFWVWNCPARSSASTYVVPHAFYVSHLQLVHVVLLTNPPPSHFHLLGWDLLLQYAATVVAVRPASVYDGLAAVDDHVAPTATVSASAGGFAFGDDVDFAGPVRPSVHHCLGLPSPVCPRPLPLWGAPVQCFAQSVLWLRARR
jgi:hypothetical protein